MAYIVGKTSAVSDGIVTTLGVDLFSHQTDDLLLMCVTQDVGSGTFSVSGTAAWTAIGTQAASAGVRHHWFYRLAASASETNPTVTSTLSDEMSATCFVVRDVDTTTPIHASAKNDGTAPLASPSLTPTVDNCLLFYSFGLDGTNQHAVVDPGNVLFLDRVDDSLATSQIIGIYQQQTAAAAPSITCQATVADGGTGWIIAVTNATGGGIMPILQQSGTVLARLGSVASDTDLTYGLLSDVTTTIAGKTVNTASYIVGTPVSNLTISPGGLYQQLGSNVSMSDNWWGMTMALASTANISGKQVVIEWGMLTNIAAPDGAEGFIVVFVDSTGDWSAFKLATLKQVKIDQPYCSIISPDTATPLDTSAGAIDWTDITKIGIAYHRTGSITTARYFGIKTIFMVDVAKFVGGSNDSSIKGDIFGSSFLGNGNPFVIDKQGSGQTFIRVPVQIGDGSTPTYYKAIGESVEFPDDYNPATGQIYWNVQELGVDFTVYASASDVMDFGASVYKTASKQSFVIHSSSSTSATYNFGGAVFVGFVVTWKTGVPCVGALFTGCYAMDMKGADLTNCTVEATLSTDAAVDVTENGANYDGVEIDVTGTSANYHLALGTSVTAIELADVTFTGTPGVDKVHVKATSGTVTITISGSTNLVAGDITSEGATVTLVAPSVSRGLEFTDLIAGSKVKVFETGTDNELFSDAASSTTETWMEEVSGSITVDYVVMKTGYLPIRVTGVTVTGQASGGVVSTPIQQVVDRAYVASSGLTINTNIFANTTTKKLGLTAASTLQNVYSYLIEQWIALGDEGEAFANVAFPLDATGPNSFTFKLGWEWDTTTYPNSITNLSRDGMRYLNTSGTVTATWAAVLSVGVPAGKYVRYQQSDGSNTGAAVATGDIDQLIQIYGDASHGNFDYSNYLVCKVQADGYDEVSVDVVDQYGTLEDYLYVIALQPVANGLTTGDPGVTGITITDHGASPVTWNGKVYSITITDSASPHTGTEVMRWLRYNFEQGGTFQGKTAFNWHDLTQVFGSSFKTVRGVIYGDTGATLKGVRVVKSDGSTVHAGFNLFTADDGTTYTPPVQITISNSNIVSGSRVRLYNVTQGIELENVVTSTTGYTFTNLIGTGEDVEDGDVIRIQATYANGTSYKENYEESAVASESGITFLGSQVAWAEANALSLDGSLETEFSTDYVNVEVDVSATGNTFGVANLIAWVCYIQTTADGIRNLFGVISAVDAANWIINTSVVDLMLDNIDTATATQADSVILMRDDQVYPQVVPTSGGGGIGMIQSGLVFVTETGVSGLTTAESEKLDAITSIPGDVWEELAASHDNAGTMGEKLNGAGAAGDPWSVDISGYTTTDTAGKVLNDAKKKANLAFVSSV